MISLGIYEKALPKVNSWREELLLVKKLGFNFLELSIDESDERLARLDWSRSEREKVREAIWETGIRIHTLMLSGQRRYPMGSLKTETRKISLEMLKKAIDLASDIGIRNIQLAGYDVFYETKNVLTREFFLKNLKEGVDYAASKEVMLAVETMDDSFMNSLQKVVDLKKQIHSPWLQAYPDIGNLTAWAGNDVACELENGLDSIVSIHLKDTYPVTKTEEGTFRGVPFGKGTVDFEGCLHTLKRLDYQGALTIEMWSEKSSNPIYEVEVAKKYFDDLFEKLGIIQEKNHVREVKTGSLRSKHATS